MKARKAVNTKIYANTPIFHFYEDCPVKPDDAVEVDVHVPPWTGPNVNIYSGGTWQGFSCEGCKKRLDKERQK